MEKSEQMKYSLGPWEMASSGWIISSRESPNVIGRFVGVSSSNQHVEEHTGNCILIESAPEMLDVIRQQHEAIDILFAMLVESKNGFMPTQSGRPWQAAARGSEIIKRFE